MKALFFILLLLPFTAFCQTDSTTIKLNQYKSWRDAGVISEEEYGQLKARLLQIPLSAKDEPSAKKQIDTAALKNLLQKAKSNTTGGIVMMSLGGVFIIGTTVYRYAAPVVKNRTDTDYKIGIGGGYAVGGVSMVVGGILLGVGIHNRVLYNEGKKNLALVLDEDKVGLAFNF